MLYFSSFIFKKIRFHWKRQPFRKNVRVEEELDGIDIDGIGNFEGSPRVAIIHAECGNLLEVNDGGGRTRDINQKKK